MFASLKKKKKKKQKEEEETVEAESAESWESGWRRRARRHLASDFLGRQEPNSADGETLVKWYRHSQVLLQAASADRSATSLAPFLFSTQL